MNLVDVILLVGLIAVVAAGARAGASVQVGFLIGFTVGMLLGSISAPLLTGVASGFFARSVVTLVAVFGLATLFAVVGYRLGRRLRGEARPGAAGIAGRVAGGATAAVTLLVGGWFVGSTWVVTPGMEAVSSRVQGSIVLRAVDRVLPPLPRVFAPIGALLEVPGAPRVFAGFEPTPREPVDLPSPERVRRAVDAARAGTVLVSGPGCGTTLSGSGFVVDPDLVVTNAHVIAGVEELQVRDGEGVHEARAVLFDADLDLAILRVPGLPAQPLEPLDGTVERGATGVALGYPLGLFTAQPVAVLARLTAEGHDLYGRDVTHRDVYQLAGRITEGQSGGPVVRPDGTVIAVVFGRSLVHEGIGYALSMPAVLDAVEQAADAEPVSTGRCAR